MKKVRNVLQHNGISFSPSYIHVNYYKETTQSTMMYSTEENLKLFCMRIEIIV